MSDADTGVPTWADGVPDDEGLDGRVAVVTGAGAADDGIGNGRAAAVLLARAGCRVLCVDRQAEPAERTVEMILADGGEAQMYVADVTDRLQCEDMVRAAVAAWGRLDVLDNNVGVGSRGSVLTDDPDRFDRVLHINVASVVEASRAALPAIIETGGGGSIVNVSSVAAVRPSGLTAYSASKGAVISLTAAMAVDHGRDGIRVNCVAPGPVYTPLVADPGMTDEMRQARRRAGVLGTEGTGWDVGHAVRFLAGDRARWITGQTLVVDGGVTLRTPTRR